MPHRTLLQKRVAALDGVLFINADLALPEEPGIYIVCTKQYIPLYVGRSRNMRLRWSSGHHKALACMRAGADMVKYVITADLEQEQDYIDDLQPYLNDRAA
jgi:excinuclease UvrABC nuclease subunit